jgi:hypothetical protein
LNDFIETTVPGAVDINGYRGILLAQSRKSA